MSNKWHKTETYIARNLKKKSLQIAYIKSIGWKYVILLSK